jgi:hypothetical protein
MCQNSLEVEGPSGRSRTWFWKAPMAGMPDIVTDPTLVEAISPKPSIEPSSRRQVDADFKLNLYPLPHIPERGTRAAAPFDLPPFGAGASVSAHQ